MASRKKIRDLERLRKHNGYKVLDKLSLYNDIKMHPYYRPSVELTMSDFLDNTQAWQTEQILFNNYLMSIVATTAETDAINSSELLFRASPASCSDSTTSCENVEQISTSMEKEDVNGFHSQLSCSDLESETLTTAITHDDIPIVQSGEISQSINFAVDNALHGSFLLSSLPSVLTDDGNPPVVEQHTLTTVRSAPFHQFSPVDEELQLECVVRTVPSDVKLVLELVEPYLDCKTASIVRALTVRDNTVNYPVRECREHHYSDVSLYDTDPFPYVQGRDCIIQRCGYYFRRFGRTTRVKLLCPVDFVELFKQSPANIQMLLARMLGGFSSRIQDVTLYNFKRRRLKSEMTFP